MSENTNDKPYKTAYAGITASHVDAALLYALTDGLKDPHRRVLARDLDAAMGRLNEEIGIQESIEADARSKHEEAESLRRAAQDEADLGAEKELHDDDGSQEFRNAEAMEFGADELDEEAGDLQGMAEGREVDIAHAMDAVREAAGNIFEAQLRDLMVGDDEAAKPHKHVYTLDYKKHMKVVEASTKDGE